MKLYGLLLSERRRTKRTKKIHTTIKSFIKTMKFGAPCEFFVLSLSLSFRFISLILFLHTYTHLNQYQYQCQIQSNIFIISIWFIERYANGFGLDQSPLLMLIFFIVQSLFSICFTLFPRYRRLPSFSVKSSRTSPHIVPTMCK